MQKRGSKVLHIPKNPRQSLLENGQIMEKTTTGKTYLISRVSQENHKIEVGEAGPDEFLIW